MWRLFALVVAAGAAWAQWQPTAPRLGCLLDAGARLRPLWGIAGNFVTGEPVLEGVISAACRGAWITVKFERQLLLLDNRGAAVARWDAPSGSALFAFDDAARPALVYFPEARLLCRIGPRGLETLREFHDDVVAIGRLGEDKALRVVRRAGGLDLIEFSLAGEAPDEVLETLPWDGDALVLDQGAVLVAEGSQIHLRKAGGAVRTYPLPSPVSSLRLLGDGWIEAVSVGDAGRFALRVTGEDLVAFALPEVAP